MLRFICLFVTSLVSIVVAKNANAVVWNPQGHKVTASICYRRLEPEMRAAVANLLRKHPRYDEDFLRDMPNEIRRGDREEQDEWLFQQAAAWPDFVRDGPDARTKYHRPSWHYINLPHYLTPADRAVFEGNTHTKLNMQPPADPDDQNQNVVQAIKSCYNVLGSDESVETKAVFLCWLLHCVGDLHQPHHSTALYSRRLFPEGDRGANRITTVPLDNLHAAWDRSLEGSSFRDYRNSAIEYLNDKRSDRIIRMSLRDRAPEKWLEETYELAIEQAYNREIMAQLMDREANGDDLRRNPLLLSENYLRNRRAVADVQIVAAGARMAEMLKSFAKPEKTNNRKE